MINRKANAVYVNRMLRRGYKRFEQIKEDSSEESKKKNHGLKEMIESKQKEIEDQKKQERLQPGGTEAEKERPDLATGEGMDTEAFLELMKGKNAKRKPLERGLRKLDLMTSGLTTDNLKKALMERIDKRYESLLDRKEEAVGILGSSLEDFEKHIETEYVTVKGILERNIIVGDTPEKKARRMREFEVAIAKADLLQDYECILDEARSNKDQKESDKQSLEELYERLDKPQLDYRALMTLFGKAHRSCVRMACERGSMDQNSTVSRYERLDTIMLQNLYARIHDAYKDGKDKIIGMKEKKYREKWIEYCKKIFNDEENAKKDRSMMDYLRKKLKFNNDEELRNFAIEELAKQWGDKTSSSEGSKNNLDDEVDLIKFDNQ